MTLIKKYAPTVLWILLGLACLWGAAGVHVALRQWRAEQAPDIATLESSPPLVVFTTVALGGFRGILADMLWMRITRLQDEGSLFEMAQLADWITKLEPHFTTVWAFHAWNMAYNISYLFPDPEDRWRWVGNGIRLLRDEGLRYNPRNAGLHWELGWIYQHKIGFILDRAHWVYKRKLAEEMGRFFEGAAPDYATLASDPRAELMRNAAKLEPAVMATIDEQYGPLDWRLPAAHALYWAYCGRQLTTAQDAWRRNCDHMICQCSADLFRHGQLTLTDDLYFTAPDLDLLPKVLGAFESALYSHPQEQLFAFAYINFISQAMLITYAFNQLEPARELFATLQANYPGADSQDFETTAEGLLDARLADMPFVMAVPLIEGFLFQYYYWQAGGESQRAGACAKRAGEIWEHYMATRVDEEHRAQTGLPPLAAIRRHAWQRAWQEVPAAWQGPLLALLPADEAVAGQR